ncbi:MAG: L-threonylcarbamoyladenylate synthase [Acidimicrobiales bacterium]
MVVLAASGDPVPEAALSAAADALAAGRVVVVPTDTVYGLAVDPSRPGASQQVFAVKRRPSYVALPVLVAGVEQALELAGELPEAARRLMGRFWPGGLTVVVPRRPGLGMDLGGPDERTVGLRLPAHPVPVALAARAGPLAVTSANRHGWPTPPTAAGVVDHLGGDVAVVLDAGPCVGTPSTVVSCLDGEVRVLRAGQVPPDAVLAAAG